MWKVEWACLVQISTIFYIHINNLRKCMIPSLFPYYGLNNRLSLSYWVAVSSGEGNFWIGTNPMNCMKDISCINALSGNPISKPFWNLPCWWIPEEKLRWVSLYLSNSLPTKTLTHTPSLGLNNADYLLEI